MPEIILNPVVDTLDGVPETHRDLYEDRDGKFVLSKPIKIDDPTELRSALAQERELRKKASEASKNLPPEIQEKIKKADELERREMERQGQYQELLKGNEEKFKAELSKREERISVLTSSLEASAKRNTATAVLNAARGDVEGLLPHVLPQLRAVESETAPGEFEVWVIDPKKPNEPRLNAKGQPMSVEDLVGELREHRTLSKLFDASPASGPGGGGSNFRPGQPRIVTLTPEEAKNPKRYQQLKEQAKKGEIDGVVDAQGRRLF